MTADPPETSAANLDTPAVAVAPAGAGASKLSTPDDIVDEWGRQSFPASDPPANW